HSSPPHGELHPFPTRRSSDLGVHLRAHEQHAPVLAHPDPRVGHGQPVHESRALVADIDGGNVADPELTLKEDAVAGLEVVGGAGDRKSTRLNSSHVAISYAVF